MDRKTTTELLELSKLSHEVMINLGSSIKALAVVHPDSPDFHLVLDRSREVNREADRILQKQRDTIRALGESR